MAELQGVLVVKVVSLPVRLATVVVKEPVMAVAAAVARLAMAVMATPELQQHCMIIDCK